MGERLERITLDIANLEMEISELEYEIDGKREYLEKLYIEQEKIFNEECEDEDLI